MFFHIWHHQTLSAPSRFTFSLLAFRNQRLEVSCPCFSAQKPTGNPITISEIPALTETVGESAEKALSIKDLLVQHRKKESCNDCHARLDPWGVPFEHYNAIGKFQPKVPKNGLKVQAFNEKNHKNLKGYFDYLDSINTVEVDAKIRVPNGPEVSDMKGLKDYIIKHRIDDVANNMTRRLLAYGLGRHLDFKDRPKVDELLSKSKKNNYKLRDMLTDICTSELFKQ